jgi:hypothetical protein
MSDVFISYKRRLRPRVEEIAEQLKRLGLTVWFDAELEPGTTFSAEISHEVRTARCVLVCWTNDAFPHGGDEHGWVVGEATIGRSRKVLVAATLEPTDLDPPWNTVHCEDLSDWTPRARGSRRDAWGRIVDAIGRHVDRPGLPELDAALVVGSIRALTGWLREFPDDPWAPRVEEQIEQRRNRRKTRVPVSPPPERNDIGPSSDPDTDLALAVERGLMEVTPDVGTDEQEWLERDLALSADLSFEHEKLEEAVAAALYVPVTDQSSSVPQPATPIPPGPVTALIDGTQVGASTIMLATAVATAASAGVSIFVALAGWSESPVGTGTVGILCPILFGGILALFGGRRAALARVLLISLLCPIIAVTASVLAMVAQALVPAPIGTLAFGAVGSFVGTSSMLALLSANGVHREMHASEVIWWSLGAAVATGLAFTVFSLDARGMYDAAWMVFVWEVLFGAVLVLSNNRAVLAWLGTVRRSF